MVDKKTDVKKNVSETNDDYTSFADGIRGNPRNNEKGMFWTNWITKDRFICDQLYRSSWVLASIIDSLSEDMTRDGIDILGIDSDTEKNLQKYITVKGVWRDLCNTIKWSRLYGGCIAYIDIKGQDRKTALDISTISKGQFRGLKVFDRWEVNPQFSNEDYLNPSGYQIAGSVEIIHHSRFIKMIGTELPYRLAIEELGWGDSVLERIFQRLDNRDNAFSAVVNLLNKAHVRTMRIDNLREIIAAGGKAKDNLVKMMMLTRDMQDNSGFTIMDKNDEYNTDSYTFSGIDDILSNFDQDISAASGIPMTRLFGQSPRGFNDGDSDLRNYYDRVESKQESMLRFPLTKLLSICYRSCFGEQPPADIDFEFINPWKPSQEKQRELTVSELNTILASADYIGADTMLKELRDTGKKVGLFQNITDEEIERNKPLENPPSALTDLTNAIAGVNNDGSSKIEN